MPAVFTERTIPMNAKRCFVAALLCLTSFSAVAHAGAAATKPKAKAKAKPTAADRRKADLRDLYSRGTLLYVKRNANKTNVSIVAAEGNTIFTGEAYRGVLEAEQQDLAIGNYFPNTTVESFDFRVVSSSTTAAVIRVCERLKSTGAFSKKDDSPAVDPFPLVVTDLQFDAIYSVKAKRWLISKSTIIGDTEGKSRCADGK
jgi:hypothetical protein